MPDTTEALGVLLVLLPGFSCAYLVQRLVVRPRQTELDKVVEALLFSFLLYLAASPFFGYSLPLSWQRQATQGIAQYTFQLNWTYLAALAGLALVLGLLYSANLNNDWLLRPLRKIGVTHLTARSSIWNDAFYDIQSTYVLVQLKDGRSLIGFVRYYSDEAKDSSIFLEDAAWIESVSFLKSEKKKSGGKP